MPSATKVQPSREQKQAASNEFYAAVQKKALKAVGSKIRGDLFPVESDTDFPWRHHKDNRFNERTLQYITRRVVPGTYSSNSVDLETPNSFPNSYEEVLQKVIFAFSDEDQSLVNKTKTKADVQANSLLNDYQSEFGTITDEDLEEAKQESKLLKSMIKTRLDYILVYMAGYVWSGRESEEKAPITWKEMQEARNLRDLLKYAPPSANSVLQDISTYLNIMQPVLSLESQRQNASYLLGQLQANTQQPTAQNGGVQVIEADGGRPDDYRLSYDIVPDQGAILNELEGGNTVTIEMETKSASRDELEVNVKGEAGGSFTVFDVLTIGGSTSTEYKMSKITGASSEMSIKMDYKGVSIITLTPDSFDQSTRDGWFNAEPIRQAVENGDKDVTGYKFVGGKPPFTIAPVGKGGNFGQLKNLVICQYPTITITYHNANYSQFKESFEQKTRASAKLFGFIPLGSVEGGVYKSKVEAGSSDESFSVTFSPAMEIVSESSLQASAYVIGATVDTPGVTN